MRLQRLCLTLGLAWSALGTWGFIPQGRAEEARETTQVLFDGKTLDGWVVEGSQSDKQGRPLWSVAEGKIVCSGDGFGFLRYHRQEFADFRVHVDYRFTPQNPKDLGNSGLGIRTIPFDPKRNPETLASFAAWEIQLCDQAKIAPSAHGTGSLYRYASPKANPVKPAPEWNTIEVECRGPNITVTINNELVLEANQNEIPDIKDHPKSSPAPKNKPLKGYISLQSHSGKVEFRNIRITTWN